jgi:hypothetical protein
LNSKLQELSLFSNSSLYDFIVLTETWLSQSVMDGEVFDIYSYNVFRCDRDFGTCKIKRGGGVLMAIKSNIKAVKLDTSNIGNLSEVNCVDLVAVEAVLGNKSLVICALYIPPGSKVDCYHSHLYLQAVKLEIWQRRVWVYSFISPRLLDSVFVSLNQKQ